MKFPRRANVITGGLFTLSAAILIGVVYFAMNIQVIKDWTLSLPDGDIHAGDSIVVSSTYTKLRQVTGTSTRSIECAVKPGIYLSTTLNKASANRAASPGNKTGTGLLVTIPVAMKGIGSLPDACHICVALRYPVLPGRTVPYFKCTKDFELLPASVSSVAPTTTQPSPALNGVSDQSSISYPQDTSSSTSQQSNPSQQTPANPQPAENFFQRTVSGVLNIVKGGL